MGTDLLRREQLDPSFGPTAQKGLEQLRHEFNTLDQDFAAKVGQRATTIMETSWEDLIAAPPPRIQRRLACW
eukprot:8981927-Prorocentrum_lima.AAC.1